MHPNHKTFINQVESTYELDSRYANIKCINYVPGKKRTGVLSLVFRAKDILEDKPVAIKFMDPAKLGDSYRLEAFKREPEILRLLQGRKRCLTLESDLRDYDWELVDPSTGAVITSHTISYFVMEWLDEEVEPTFMNQDAIAALEKLTVFRMILLAVETVHSEGIAHRDLKADNMRYCIRSGAKTITVIDFGTAASFDSVRLTGSYDEPVGANAFAPPEAYVGFACEREVGRHTDAYSLGCLLFQLFNKQLYAEVLVNSNPTYDTALWMLKGQIFNLKTFSEKVDAWKQYLPQYLQSVSTAPINSPGHSLPVPIEKVITNLHRQMVAVDFSERLIDLKLIRNRVDCAIKILANGLSEERERARRRIWRENRLAKIKRNDERLAEFLQKSVGRLSRAQC